jgi:hypothetical protein
MADGARLPPVKKKHARPNAKGKPENLTRAGMGRPPGAVNKTTALLKDAILQAAERAGNTLGDAGLISYLEVQAVTNPGPFMSLLGKVLPMQVQGMGEDGAIITEIVIRGVSATNR